MEKGDPWKDIGSRERPPTQKLVVERERIEKTGQRENVAVLLAKILVDLGFNQKEKALEKIERFLAIRLFFREEKEFLVFYTQCQRDANKPVRGVSGQISDYNKIIAEIKAKAGENGLNLPENFTKS
jgi:hypothetical protein